MTAIRLLVQTAVTAVMLAIGLALGAWLAGGFVATKSFVVVVTTDAVLVTTAAYLVFGRRSAWSIRIATFAIVMWGFCIVAPTALDVAVANLGWFHAAEVSVVGFVFTLGAVVAGIWTARRLGWHRKRSHSEQTLAAEYPWQAKQVEIESVAMSMIDAGQGPPLFLVHGTPSWSFEFRHVIRALEYRFRCIAPDHLGFGHSARPDFAGYSPEAHAQRLLALFDKLDLRDVTLVLHDIGGPIGARLVSERADRIARVVLMNTWMWPSDEQPGMRAAARILGSRLGAGLYRAGLPFLLMKGALADPQPPDVSELYTGRFPRARDRALVLHPLMRSLTASDTYYRSLAAAREKLRGLPVLIVWGLRDPAFPESTLDHWRRELPDAEVVTVPDAGHSPQEERPDRVSLAILRFVEQSVTTPES